MSTLRQYLEWIIDPKIRNKYKMGETSPHSKIKKEVPGWLSEWIDSASVASKKYGNEGYESIKSIENDIIKNKVMEQNSRILILNDGNFYSSKTGKLVHNHILAYLMYKGVVEMNESYFKEWRKNINIATTVPFLMMQQKYSYLCISESYYLRKSNPVLEKVADMITKKGNKFESGIKNTGLILCPFGVDTKEADNFIRNRG